MCRGAFSDGQRHHSGNIDEREVAHNLFVPQGPSARTRHDADTVARGAVRLASVSAVAVGHWWALAGSRRQVCGQDGLGYRCACSTCIYRKDAADVSGVSWRMGFNFGKCGSFFVLGGGGRAHREKKKKLKRSRLGFAVVLCCDVSHYRRGALVFPPLPPVGLNERMMCRPISLACIAYLGHCECITPFSFLPVPPPPPPPLFAGC